MAEQLKNVYTENYVKNLALKIKQKHNSFDENAFIDSVFNEIWDSLELKMRMRHLAVNLNKHLHLPYFQQLEILKIVSMDFSSFEAMFFQDFVEVYGLEDFENSIKALEVFTIDSSSEFAIRQFILKYEDETMEQMKIWSQSSNEHLRRLSSEGCRPRLPWAIALPKFKKDPSKVLEILELLKNDKSKYVQKSVANNLNDISKDNPHLVVEFVKNNLGISSELDWICKHASRTLLKKANTDILNLFGFNESNHVNITNFSYDKIVKENENLNFSFDLESSDILGNIRVEYTIDYLKANKKHNKKVFMISQNNINTNKKTFIKKQSFKTMSTRKHYLGTHFISIILNGKEILKKEFLLK